MEKKRIGLLTGGGDAPGLNAVIRAVTIRAMKTGNFEVIGFHNGWAGLLKKDYRILKVEDVEEIHLLGGTILGSSRTNPAKEKDGYAIARKNMDDLNLHALVVVGGDDTLGVALKLYNEGGNIIGVPKTIDNDVQATEYTFGFDTAINRVMEFLEMLRTTADSHHRVMVVEIMGRHAGWIALQGGMAGGAHLILVPEEEFYLKDVVASILRRYKSGKHFAVIAVSEGAVCHELEAQVLHSSQTDDFGHVQLGTGIGIGETLANYLKGALKGDKIRKETGLDKIEVRHLVLGHLQRGGAPSAFDRVLGTRFGVKVVEMIERGDFGKMTALQQGKIVPVNLEKAVGELKLITKNYLDTAKLFYS